MKNPLRTLLLASLLLAFSATALFASGTSYPAAVSPAAQDPLVVTASMKCRVLEVRDADGALKIQDPKTEEISWVQVGERTRLRAQNKKAFDGRKKLQFADLEVGQLLRIQHRPHTGEVLKIKVLKES